MAVVTALAAGMASTVLVQPAQAGGRPLDAELTGAAEVPKPGDPDGFGSAEVRINPGQQEICYSLEVSDIAPASAAHIHLGTAGVAGPVVVALVPPTSGESAACVQVTREVARAIIKNPANYYVNVHNAEFPAGALRGQLTK